MYLDKLQEASLPGSIYVENTDMPELKIGTTIKIEGYLMITKEIIVKTSGGIHVGIAASIKSIIKNKEHMFYKTQFRSSKLQKYIKIVALNIMQGKKIVLMVDGAEQMKKKFYKK